MKVYRRTENGVTTTISQKMGLNEINHAMMGGRSAVKEMSSITRTDYAIKYRDGRDVRLVLAEVADEVIAMFAEAMSPERQVERRAIAAQALALPESPALVEVSRAEAGDPIADAYLAAQAATEAPAQEPERALLYRRNDGNHVYGPVLTFKGKRYVLDGGVSERTGRVNYFSVRNGERFGPVRDSFPSARPGTVGHAVAIFARGMVSG